MTKYHDIYKYVCDRIKPSERSIQRYRDELGHYYEILVKITLKIALKKEFTEFNHVIVDETILKAHNSNQNMISKKEAKLLVQYYKGLKIDPKQLEKLKNLLKKY